jgi:lambda repressor-like predicted transcriptional regulator
VAKPGIFPFQPVFDLLSPDNTLRKRTGDRFDGVVPRAASRLGVDRRYVYRWLQRGLDADQALAVATMLDLHPSFIWPDWFEKIPTEEEVAIAEKKRAAHPAPKPRPHPRSVDPIVALLRKFDLSWGEIAMELYRHGWTNWRNGKPWRADQLRSVYGGAAR